MVVDIVVMNNKVRLPKFYSFGNIINLNQKDWLSVQDVAGTFLDFEIVSTNEIVINNIDDGEIITVSVNPSIITNYLLPLKALYRDVYVFLQHIINTIRKGDFNFPRENKPAAIPEPVPAGYALTDCHVSFKEKNTILNSSYNKEGAWVHCADRPTYIIGDRHLVFLSSFLHGRISSGASELYEFYENVTPIREGNALIYKITNSRQPILVCTRI